MPLTLITAASDEPLTWTQLQMQLRLDTDDDQGFGTEVLIPAARDRMEGSTRRAALPQRWQYIIDGGFPCDPFIEIPKPPLIGVDFVKYVDMQGVTQTWDASNYLVQAPVGPRCARGRVALPFSSVWPIAQPIMGAVTIQFQCGYADAAHIPPMLIAAMLQDCGSLYENREGLVVDSRAVAVRLPDFTADIYTKFRSLPTQRFGQESYASR